MTIRIYSKDAQGLSVPPSYSVSSQQFQFHWVNTGDSKGIVTPFMRVETYSTGNFATLGPL